MRHTLEKGFPGGTSGREPTCQCRRCKIWVQSLGWNDPLEKGMATYSNILAWKIPWTGKPSGLQSMGLQRIEHNWTTGSSKKQESFRKTSISALLTMPNLWLCGSQQTLENSSRGGDTRSPDPPLEKSRGGEATVRTGHGTTDWFQIGKGVR